MLTPAQKTTLKAAIIANSTWNAYPNTTDGNYDLAQLLSIEASPSFWVWSTNADAQAVRAQIDWAKLTPADVPDGTQAWANRSLQCQGKQFNLQLLLPMIGTFNGSDSNARAGLQDALTAVRSGVGGASQNAGWNAVQAALARRAKSIEKIFADTSGGSDGSTKPLSATMTWEGAISADDVQQARNS